MSVHKQAGIVRFILMQTLRQRMIVTSLHKDLVSVLCRHIFHLHRDLFIIRFITGLKHGVRDKKKDTAGVCAITGTERIRCNYQIAHNITLML